MQTRNKIFTMNCPVIPTGLLLMFELTFCSFAIKGAQYADRNA